MAPKGAAKLETLVHKYRMRGKSEKTTRVDIVLFRNDAKKEIAS